MFIDVNIPPLSIEKCVNNIVVFDDSDVELTEYFTISFSEPPGANIDAIQDTADIFIIDNDGKKSYKILNQPI